MSAIDKIATIVVFCFHLIRAIPCSEKPVNQSDKNNKAFFALLRAGLWEKEARLLPYGEIDIAEVQRLAEEQSVVGLIAAGLEHVADVTVAKKDVLQLIGQTLQLEQRNAAMNGFIVELVGRMRKAGIETVLVKGQGVAQCYERPLWRTCGDVDLFLSDDNYEKAKAFLTPVASKVETEGKGRKHLGMTIGDWVVELHGSLRMGLPSRINDVLDEIRDDVFCDGKVRTWQNGETQVFLPCPDGDAVYVFVHFFNHFYKGGIGLRQICDWCRLLWTYRSEIDVALLEKRLRSMGLVSEWKAFGAFAVEYLGMPPEAMPLYDGRSGKDDEKGKKKARLIMEFVMEVGNFGHNRDRSYFSKYPYVVRKVISMGWRIGDLFRHARIFPLNSLRFFPNFMLNGLISSIRGE